MRAFALALILGCSSSGTSPAPAEDAATAADTNADVTESGPADPCAVVKCMPGTSCDKADGACKRPKDATLGATCTDASGCGAGKECLTTGFADGYCTEGCSATEPCPFGATCARLGGKTSCFVQCAIDGDCRGGVDYRCVDTSQLYVGGGNRKVCYPVAISCATNDDCPKPLTCGMDKICKAS